MSVISGMSFEQSVRPYEAEDPSLTSGVLPGATVLPLTSVTKFVHTCAGDGACNNVFIAVGEGTDAIEVRQIDSVNTTAKTVTLTQPLSKAHAATAGCPIKALAPGGVCP
jgi:ferredoxin